MSEVVLSCMRRQPWAVIIGDLSARKAVGMRVGWPVEGARAAAQGYSNIAGEVELNPCINPNGLRQLHQPILYLEPKWLR